MKKLAAILLCLPLAAVADGRHKPKEDPKPETITVRDSNYKGALIAIGFAAAIGTYVYLNEQKTKKVAVAPTDDGKGAKLAFEWRH